MAYGARHHDRIVLQTFSALTQARRLYEAAGFVRFGPEMTYDGWGPTIVDQQFEWKRATA